MTNTARAWIHGLASAFIGGASTAVSTALIDPDKFNLTTGLGNLCKAALVSGIVSASFYLKKSPLPGDNQLDGPQVTVPTPPPQPTTPAQPPTP